MPFLPRTDLDPLPDRRGRDDGGQGGSCAHAAISPDGTLVAYGWQGSLLDRVPARFRLISWDLADGSNPPADASRLVYDNARGTGLDLDDPPPPALPLGLVFTLSLPT